MSLMTLEEQEKYILKTTITADDDLDANGKGGALQPVQARNFFLLIRGQMTLNQHANIVPMRGNGIEFSQLDVTGRLLEHDTNQASSKRGISTSEKAMTGIRVKAAFKVNRAFFEQNIEGESVLSTLVDAFSKKLGNEFEQLVMLANTVGPAILQSTFRNDRDSVGSTTQYVLDSLMNIFNGMIRSAITGGTQVNASNSDNLRALVMHALKELPTHWRSREVRADLRLFMPLDLVENLQYQLSERRTNMGDQFVTMDMQGNIKIHGIPVIGLPLMDTNPTYVENVTLGTTGAAIALNFGYIEDTDVIVTASTLGTTAIDKYALTTDYTIHETNGTITWAGTGGDITSGQTVKVTYPSSPLFILTPKSNILIGLNEDMRIEYDNDYDLDVLNVYFRTRINMLYRELDCVVLCKNVKNSLITAATI